MKEFYARICEVDKRRKQLLSVHLSNVAKLSGQLSAYTNLSKLIGLLHDFGKASESFNDYLKNGGERGSVVHALQGAFFMDDTNNGSEDAVGKLLKEIAAMVIAAHHGGLDDGVSPDGEIAFSDKLLKKGDVKYQYDEVKENMQFVLPELINRMNELSAGAKEEVRTIINSIGKTYTSANSAQFALGLFVKYIYSCLIDADRLDAYLFEVNEKHMSKTVDWGILIDIFEESIEKFNDKSKIAVIRREISRKCKEVSEKPTGIYHLSVPTGGGKTLSSLRFALHHSKIKSKKRIIYVIPYLSIIDQTASELRKILNLRENNDIILEHHSGIVLPEGEDDLKIRKLSTSRWDNPIILTTMVQFLETIMSSRGGDLRKFHNMSDSVIIFDEIQALPVNTIHLFNEAVSFLAKICNTTILLCTATQPLLDKTERRNLLLESNPKLFDCGVLFDGIKRTSIVSRETMDTDEFADFVLEKSIENGNCMAIVNTKNTARKVYDKLKGQREFAVFHLTTSMCQIHRVETISKIKYALNQKKKIICVATQLIEAGVDISFTCVVRAAAGLDSVAQAAGRCNRNGESETPKEVYVIPISDENLDKLADIKSGKEITERLMREYSSADLQDTLIMEQFYKYYFHERKGLMDYNVKGDKTIYDMLSLNSSGKGNLKNKTGADFKGIVVHAFQTAGEEFSVLDKKTTAVVVLYGEAEKLTEEYRKQPRDIITKEKISVIRTLEKYSVSLYPWEMEKLSGVISILDEETGIKILSKMHYSEEVGVVFEPDPNDFIVTGG